VSTSVNRDRASITHAPEAFGSCEGVVCRWDQQGCQGGAVIAGLWAIWVTGAGRSDAPDLD
jgi:hypothetical protein